MNRYQVSIGGKWLHTYLNSDKRFKGRVWVEDIQYAEPSIKRTIETAGDADGGIITRTYREKASVTILFNVLTWDPTERYDAIESIRSLAAKGGTILTSNRPNRALFNAVCETYPEIVSSKARTDTISMTFSAYAFPYWQDKADPTPKTLSNTTNTSMSVTVPGNAPRAKCTVEIIANENFGGNSNLAGSTVDVTVGKTTLYLAYDLQKNNYCLIDTDEHDNLRVRIYNNSTSSKKLITSGIGLLLPTSSDRLEAIPGQANTFKVRANKKVTAKLYARGAWL